MELPQSSGPRVVGGNAATHDFILLYKTASPDPQGGLVKTRDFLQPLERTAMKEERISSGVSPVHHHLHGGGNTYFDHRVIVSNPERNLFAARGMPKNGEKHTFPLWDESSAKGNSGRENIANPGVDDVVEHGGGQWRSLFQMSSHSPAAAMQKDAKSFDTKALSSDTKKQSFMDMIISTKEDDDQENNQEEEEEEDETLCMKTEMSSSSSSQPRRNTAVKVEAGNMSMTDRHKIPKTPRSKHSETEQRRRSKINDRFQKLREIIPNSEQRRDKASLLLEVIDYIQFLQHKVSKLEGPFKNDVTLQPWPPRNGNNDDSTMKFEDAALPMNEQNTTDTTTATLKEKEKKHMRCQSYEMMPKDRSTDYTYGKMDDAESISNSYSQGLLENIRQALQRSGVDLSESSISVKLNLGKRQNGAWLHSWASIVAAKEKDDASEPDTGFAAVKKPKKKQTS